jgi:hypothetical protein
MRFDATFVMLSNKPAPSHIGLLLKYFQNDGGLPVVTKEVFKKIIRHFTVQQV